MSCYLLEKRYLDENNRRNIAYICSKIIGILLAKFNSLTNQFLTFSQLFV